MSSKLNLKNFFNQEKEEILEIFKDMIAETTSQQVILKQVRSQLEEIGVEYRGLIAVFDANNPAHLTAFQLLFPDEETNHIIREFARHPLLPSDSDDDNKWVETVTMSEAEKGVSTIVSWVFRWTDKNGKPHLLTPEYDGWSVYRLHGNLRYVKFRRNLERALHRIKRCIRNRFVKKPKRLAIFTNIY